MSTRTSVVIQVLKQNIEARNNFSCNLQAHHGFLNVRRFLLPKNTCKQCKLMSSEFFQNGLKFEGLNQVKIAKALRCVSDPDVHWSQVSSGLQNKSMCPVMARICTGLRCSLNISTCLGQKPHFCVGCHPSIMDFKVAFLLVESLISNEVQHVWFL